MKAFNYNSKKLTISKIRNFLLNILKLDRALENMEKIYIRKILYLFVSQLSIILNLSANELSKSQIQFNGINEYKELNNKNIKSEYILGKGDSIFIFFYNANLFSREYLIDENGYLIMPEIDKFYAEGLTIKELEMNLTINIKSTLRIQKILIRIMISGH